MTSATMSKARAAELLATQPEATKHGLPDVGVCVQCLAAYNNGIHHFQWVDLEVLVEEGETLKQCIDWVLASSLSGGGEEWFFSDSSGLPGYLQGEHVSTEELMSYALALPEVDRSNWDAYRAVCNYMGQAVTPESFEESYLGDMEPAEYVESYYEENGEVPEYLACYVDWESMARDWVLNGDLIAVDGLLFHGHSLR